MALNKIGMIASFSTAMNESQTDLVIDIEGVIGDGWFTEGENVSRKIKAQLKENTDATRIVVNIHSLGGDLDEGIAIHDILAADTREKITNVIGFTASAATIIAQAGTSRRISTNAMYLVHRAWTIAIGNYNDFFNMAQDLEKIDTMIAGVYAKRSGQPVQTFLDLMDEANGAGIWLNAEEAVEKGLMDEAIEPVHTNGEKEDIENMTERIVMNAKKLLDHVGAPYPTIQVALLGNEESATNQVEQNERRESLNKLKLQNERKLQLLKLQRSH